MVQTGIYYTHTQSKSRIESRIEKSPSQFAPGGGFFVSLLGLPRAVVPRLDASVRMFFKDDAVGRDAASGIRKATGEG